MIYAVYFALSFVVVIGMLHLGCLLFTIHYIAKKPEKEAWRSV